MTLTSAPRRQVCDWHRDCDPGFTDELQCGACDFESGLCGLSDVSRGAFSWKRATDTTFVGVQAMPLLCLLCDRLFDCFLSVF